jgi:hypothetical protein
MDIATVQNWVETMESGQGQIYPYVGTEVWWLVLAIVIWLVWHVTTGIRETEEHEEVRNRAPGSNDHKNNITNW